jgi:AcrR family transcriptional regulator
VRADAQRNYDRLVDVAREAFTELGPDAPLDVIARRAGVGAGTLYRHFPSRDALVEAVYRSDVEEVCALAYQLLAERPPADALAAWLRAQVEHVRVKRGLGAALIAAFGEDSELFAWCRQNLRAASGALLSAARDAGAVRADVEPADLLRFGHAIAVSTELAPDSADRLLAVVLDGLGVAPLRQAAGPAVRGEGDR